MNVVSLAECRDLLKSWDQLRSLVANGRSFAVCVEGQDGDETVVFAGRYQNDRSAALNASMRISWELTKATKKESQPAARIR